MEPGSAQPLTPSEVEEAFASAPYTINIYVEWRNVHNKRHRDGDLPARVCSKGSQQWYQHGIRHRANGLPAIIRRDGKMAWYDHGRHIGNDQNPPLGTPSCLLPSNGQKTKSANKK